MSSEKAKRLMKYCQRNDRICPINWTEFYDLLPNKKQSTNGSWMPPLPLVLAAWQNTSPLMKVLRLREHIDHADRNGAIDTINQFLRSLKEDEWHHIGE